MASSQPRATPQPENEHVVQAMRLRISQLESQNATLSQQLGEKTTALSYAEERLQSFRSQAHDVVNQWQASTEEARRHFAEAQSEVTRLQHALTTITEEHNRLIKVHTQVALTNSQLEEAVAAAQSSLKQQQATHNDELAKLSSQCTRLEHIALHAESELKIKEKVIEELQESMQTVSQREDESKKCAQDAVQLARVYRDQLEAVEAQSRAASEERQGETMTMQEQVAHAQAETAEQKRLAEERLLLLQEREMRIDALEAQVAVARDDCARLRDDVTTADLGAEQLLNELHAHKAQLESTTRGLSEIATERERLSSLVKDLQEQMIVMKSTNESLESDIVEHLDTIEMLKRTTVQLEGTIHDMSLNGSHAERERDALIRERDSLVSDVQQKSTELEQVQRLLDEHRVVSQEQQELFVELQRSFDVMSQKAADLETENQKLREERTGLHARALEIQEKLVKEAKLHDDAEAAATTLRSELERTKRELSETLSLCEERQHIIEEQSTCLSEVQHTVASQRVQMDAEAEMHRGETILVNTKLAEALEAQQQMELKNADIRKRLDSAIADRDLYMRELGVTRRQQTDLEAFITTRIDGLGTELEQTREEKDVMHGALMTARQECERVEQKLREANDEVKQCRALLEAAKEEARELGNDVQRLDGRHLAQLTHISALEQRCNEYLTSMESLHRERRFHEQQLQGAQAQVRKLQAAVESLESDLTTVKNDLATSEQRNMRMKTVYEERAERDRDAMNKYMEEQANQREAAVGKYTDLHEAYKVLLSKMRDIEASRSNNTNNNANTTSGGNTNEPAGSTKAGEDVSNKLAERSEAVTQLKHLLEVCRQQETELEVLRRDVSIYHRVIDSQLERAEVVDVNSVLRDRSVTVHQLNVLEGPRRHPNKRRAPSTLLGPELTPTSTSSASVDPNNNSLDLSRGAGHDGSFSSSTSSISSTSHSRSHSSSQPTTSVLAPNPTNVAAHHHAKVPRRTWATPHEEHRQMQQQQQQPTTLFTSASSSSSSSSSMHATNSSHRLR